MTSVGRNPADVAALCVSLDTTQAVTAMFHVIENAQAAASRSFVPGENFAGYLNDDFDSATPQEDYSATDIDLVDDSLLNTAPHNAIERQLLNGDMIGLALMSGAILWSAMGAFG
ncbi:MAG TPA: hypothetical protein VGC51_09630 [Hansschlegelia sp.]